MFLLTKPSQREIRKSLSSQQDERLFYPDPHMLDLRVPPGYTADHNQVKLGEGTKTFARAIEALERWEMFNIGWLELCWPDAPIETGSGVAVLAHHLGFWSLNFCRIVCVIDEMGASRRYGFTYGTLPEHAERGQERFTVEQRADGSVWYEILAYSRPNALLARVGYPVTRLLQKRFARDSMQAMLRAV